MSPSALNGGSTADWPLKVTMETTEEEVVKNVPNDNSSNITTTCTTNGMASTTSESSSSSSSVTTSPSATTEEKESTTKTTTIPSSNSASVSVKNSNKYASNLQSSGKSMADRSKIPASFVASLASILGMHLFSGTYDLKSLESIGESFGTATDHLQKLLNYLQSLCESLFRLDSTNQDRPPWSEYLVATVVTLSITWITYILFLAPLWNGFWTGPRASRHLVHRYMGLVYLIQYPLAWLEFARDYDSARNSYLPHLIALNGVTQAWSAFFSFKVLPELNDAGYYSDKSVLSRSFVHENAFFQILSVYGTLYYIEGPRTVLRSSLPGRVLEYVYVFWPYVLVRPLFPVTRFKDAGSTHKGRSATNQKFYEIGTYLVKIFFLYAKYFLGFYFNFLVFLELPTENDWRFMRGCLLLNIGTVSIAVFLHTLRFRKIFPGVLTFSIYLAQIYATILGIPFAYSIFTSHPKLMGVCLTGLLCNMTRNRKIHAVWCFAAMCLLSYKGIEW